MGVLSTLKVRSIHDLYAPVAVAKIRTMFVRFDIKHRLVYNIITLALFPCTCMPSILFTFLFCFQVNDK